MNHLRNMGTVFAKTRTVWENYAPEAITRGRPAKKDFVGWTGIGPIVYLIEYAIGIKADGIAGRIVWDVASASRVGVERFWFGGTTVDLVCTAADENGKRTLKVTSDKPFALIVNWKGRQTRIAVPAGREVARQL